MRKRAAIGEQGFVARDHRRQNPGGIFREEFPDAVRHGLSKKGQGFADFLEENRGKGAVGRACGENEGFFQMPMDALES